MLATVKRKSLVFVISLAMVFTMAPQFGMQSYAAGTPANIADQYEKDGITYVNIGDTTSFAEGSGYEFLKKALSTPIYTPQGDYMRVKRDPDTGVAELGADGKEIQQKIEKFSMGECLNMAAVAWGTDQSAQRTLNRYKELVKDYGLNNGALFNDTNWKFWQSGMREERSLAGAERNIWKAIAASSGKVLTDADINREIEAGRLVGNYQDHTKEEPVFCTYFALFNKGVQQGTGTAVVFRDFKITPILPANEGTNYVVSDEASGDVTSEVIASNIRNMTPEQVRADQTISKTTSTSLSSEINGSKSYGFEESLSVEVSASFLGTGVSTTVGFTASQAVESGWSEGKSLTNDQTEEQALGIDLPPHTVAMMRQHDATNKRTYGYNCPVAVSCKVELWNVHSSGKMEVSKQWVDSRKDLYTRAVVNRQFADKQNINWVDLLTRDYANEVVQYSDALWGAACYAPMGSTEATFTETVKTKYGEVSGIKALYPLSKVETADKVREYQMSVGDYIYADDIDLNGLNSENADYYGFNSDKGAWKIVDENGKEIDDSSVMTITTTPAGLSKVTAKAAGSAWMKYFIDEDCYDTADTPRTWATNNNVTTPMIEVKVEDVPFEGSINVAGKFTGYVGDDFTDFTDIDAVKGLRADVMDKRGKELEGRQVVWEAKETTGKGIEVSGSKVRFTKEGTFHVCARSGDVVSDWVEIKAVKKPVKATFNFGDGSEPTVIEGYRGDKITAPASKDKCTSINGWYKDASLSGNADLGDKESFVIQDNVTFHASRSQNHVLTENPESAATCEKAGNDTYWTCENCNRIFSDAAGNTEIKEPPTKPARGHKFGDWTKVNDIQHYRVCGHDPSHVETANHTWDQGKVTKEATTKEKGERIHTCTACGATKIEEIAAEPEISGILTARMTAKGKTGLLIKWNSIKGAAGYDIFFARCDHKDKMSDCKMVKSIKGNGTVTWTKADLNKNTPYKAYVKAFVYKNGEKSYVRTSPMVHAFTTGGAKGFTNAKAVKVNKAKITLKNGKTFKIKARVVKLKKSRKLMPKKHAPTIRYMTSNKKIATVSGSGKITAKGKGTCTVYVYAHNGVSKAIKVTVK